MRVSILAALVASLIAHGGLLWWVSGAPRVRRAAPPAQKRANVAVEIVEIAHLPPSASERPASSPTSSPTSSAAQGDVRPRAGPRTDSPGRAVNRVTDPGIPEPPDAPPPVREPSILGMRGTGGHSTAGAEPAPARTPNLAPGASLAPLEPPPVADAHDSRPPAWLVPRPPPRRERPGLRALGDGTYAGDDLTFRARVGRDGRVAITDKRNVQVRLPSIAGISGHLRGWAEDPYGVGANPFDDADEEPVGPDYDREEVHTVPLVSGSFDVTDAITRALGDDPYAARKLAFLDGTRAERARIAAVNEEQDLRASLAALDEHLRAVWGHTAWPAAQRREALFTLWDECAETGSEARRETATMARAIIIGFIRRTLPRGSTDAFTPAELATFNARRTSTAPFEPYLPDDGQQARDR